MKKYFMLAVTLLVTAPTCAVSEQAARAMFDHLLGKQNQTPLVQREIDMSIRNMIQEPKGRTDNEIFMNEFQFFLFKMHCLALEGTVASGLIPPIARQFTDALIADVEWKACKPNHVEWASINSAALPAGCFSDYLPSTLARALNQTVATHGQPQLIPTRFGPTLDGAQMANYIRYARALLKQLDKALSVLEALSSEPA